MDSSSGEPSWGHKTLGRRVLVFENGASEYWDCRKKTLHMEVPNSADAPAKLGQVTVLLVPSSQTKVSHVG